MNYYSLTNPKNRIHLSTKSEINFWTNRFKTSIRNIRQAIDSVGPYADLVSICLKRKGCE